MCDELEAVQFVGDTCIIRCGGLRTPAAWKTKLGPLSVWNQVTQAMYIILPPTNQPMQYPQHQQLPLELWQLPIPRCIVLIAPTATMLAALALAPAQLQRAVIICPDCQSFEALTPSPSLALRGALAQDWLYIGSSRALDDVVSTCNPLPEVHWLRRCTSASGHRQVLLVHLAKMRSGTAAELLEGLEAAFLVDCSCQFDVVLCDDPALPWRAPDAALLVDMLNRSTGWLNRWCCGYVVSESPWWRLLCGCLAGHSKLMALPGRDAVHHMYGDAVMAALPAVSEEHHSNTSISVKGPVTADTLQALKTAEEQVLEAVAARIQHNQQVDALAHRYRLQAAREYNAVLASFVAPEWQEQSLSTS